MTKFACFARWMSLGVVAAGLAGCASDPAQFAATPRPVFPTAPDRRATTIDSTQKPQQCVPYAREHSGVKIFGDAWTWWDQASGKYAQASLPQSGAVMVLTGYAGPQRGHVAVVREIVSSREIRVDHANWLDDGSVYLDDPVEDVSPSNDWSAVRVFNIRTGGWGGKVYTVQGFIGGDRAPSPGPVPPSDIGDLIARADIPERR